MKIIYTTDTHSYLFPTTYADKTTENLGVYRIAGTMEKDARTLVIDGGDSLQGSTLSKYVFTHRLENPFPQAAAFRAMGLDIAVPGNHDFNYGYKAFCSFFEQTGARLLCANLSDRTGRLCIEKHLVFDDHGTRIGITGLVTDYVNVWEKKENLENFIISDVRTTAEEELKWLKANSDIHILVYHGGLEADLKTGRIMSTSRENIAWELATQLDFDLILTGHQHMDIPFQKVGNSYLLQISDKARHFATIEVSGETISGRLCAPSTSAVRLENENSRMQEKIEAWLDTPLGTIDREIPRPTQVESITRGSHIADFFNYVQLRNTGADISCTSLANELYGFDKDMTIRQVIKNYQYSNTLEVLEVTETQLRQALERCASFICIRNGEPAISPAALEPKVELYNYDYYLGLDYGFDFFQPEGHRVNRLLFHGQPIGSRKLKLVMNNYRASGTGGYEVFRNCHVLSELFDDMQDMAIEFLHQCQGEISWPYSRFSAIPRK